MAARWKKLALRSVSKNSNPVETIARYNGLASRITWMPLINAKIDPFAARNGRSIRENLNFDRFDFKYLWRKAVSREQRINSLIPRFSILFNYALNNRVSNVETSLSRDGKNTRVYIYIYIGMRATNGWTNAKAKGNRDSNRATLLERNLFTNPGEERKKRIVET